ncbi:LLM class F420-dependent oxidoreductase [Enemella sp. A6]|uniref:LLM class F420-dependent oxidoreductase n=1 Tax=Enemella sp. A6 TaxID=3440152 RepID=UPI003EBE9E7A
MSDLKIGIGLGYWQRDPVDQTDMVLTAEELGFHSVWTAEAYGSDALVPLTWYAARTSRIMLGTAIVQLDARTPAATAMAALTLDALSGGRLILGLGVSGPQIIEGWYGRPFPKPLARTRDYLAIMRDIWERRGPVTSDSPHYPLPYPGGTGLGKPLKSITQPLRSDIPVYLGAQGPKNTALAFEIADGWISVFSHINSFEPMYGEVLATARPGFEVTACLNTYVDDDVSAAMYRAKQSMAWYVGGMGASGQNFHANVLRRAGFGDTAERVQELFLAGHREAAIEAIDDDLIDGTALIGPPKRIARQLELWRDTPLGTVILTGLRSAEEIRRLRPVLW